MHRRALYSELAKYYDRIYWWKDYEREVRFLVDVFNRHDVPVKQILEVGCGTGNHTRLLVESGYDVTGVDLSPSVLKVARKKLGRKAKFVVGDMRSLDEVIQGEFDAVVCLFSAISYNTGRQDLSRTLGGFHRHLKDGGLVVFDTHFTKEGFREGYRGEDVFDDGSVIGARLSLSTRKADVGQLTFTYLIKDGRKVTVLRDDVHRLGLFDPEEIQTAMREAGFETSSIYRDWERRKRGGGGLDKDYVFVGTKK